MTCLADDLRERFADFSGRLHDVDAGFLERLHLVGCGALAAGDDGAGVAHAAAGRRGLAGDEAYDGLLHVRLHVGCGGLFRRAADFADEDDGLGFGVFVEQRERIDVRGADDGIAADADGGGLADATLRELIDGLIGEGAGARDDADRAFLMNAAGHDADLGLAGGDDAGAVGADETRLRVLELLPDLHHVVDRDALGDADDERQAGVLSFEDGVCGEGWRNKDDGGVGAGFGDGLLDGIEDRPALVGGATFTGRYTADDFGSVFGASLGVEGAFLAGDSLNNQARIFID